MLNVKRVGDDKFREKIGKLNTHYYFNFHFDFIVIIVNGTFLMYYVFYIYISEYVKI